MKKLAFKSLKKKAGVEDSLQMLLNDWAAELLAVTDGTLPTYPQEVEAGKNELEEQLRELLDSYSEKVTQGEFNVFPEFIKNPELFRNN